MLDWRDLGNLRKQGKLNDPKIWLASEIKVARLGRTLRGPKLNRALKIIEQNHAFLLEEWNEFKIKARRGTLSS